MAPKGQPLSIRLSREAQLVIEEERRRTGRSRSAVVEELAEEAAKTRRFPGIGFRGPEPRRPWVIGSGLDVWEIAEMLGDFGSAEKLLRQTHLTERDVRLANAYTEAYPDEVGQARAENRRSTEELLELYPFVQVASRR
jgi:uncharacterized protein (DUF433 family)